MGVLEISVGVLSNCHLVYQPLYTVLCGYFLTYLLIPETS